jgi:hypothetical protein
VATRLGLAPGQLILSIGGSGDSDQELLSDITQLTGTEILEDSTSEVVDSVLLWFRDGDGDLVDDLMDAMTYLDSAGQIWVLTPKVGRDGHVEPSDIQSAAPLAGLSQTQSLSVAKDWNATRLVARKSSKR